MLNQLICIANHSLSFTLRHVGLLLRAFFVALTERERQKKTEKLPAAIYIYKKKQRHLQASLSECYKVISEIRGKSSSSCTGT